MRRVSRTCSSLVPFFMIGNPMRRGRGGGGGSEKHVLVLLCSERGRGPENMSSDHDYDRKPHAQKPAGGTGGGGQNTGNGRFDVAGNPGFILLRTINIFLFSPSHHFSLNFRLSLKVQERNELAKIDAK